MFIVTFILKNNPTPVQLNFTDKGRALAAAQIAFHELEDDFGCVLCVNHDELACSFVTDMERELDAICEKQLMQTRAQMKAQNKVRNDPTVNLMGSVKSFQQ